ncbi:MAG: general secretion pathway protein GspK [Pirellulales bacterium]|nr:general secretion pathway protein GspK [Pirellulales bacterium]
MKRRAMILIVVLVAVAALSLAALAFSALMVGEREVVHSTGRQIQARALAESGIEMVRLFLSEHPDVQFSDGTWHEDLEKFQGVMVFDDETPQGRGRFAIIAPVEDQDLGGMRFGLECESSKLNLNTLLEGEDNEQSQRDRLMALPGMTEEIADSILDWLDEDDEPREFGAEADYYESLTPPYHPTNGPIRCLEELLFVRGITEEHLYGSDRNRNGKLDTDESGETAIAEIDSTNSISPRGLSAYLTLFSREMVVQPDGSPKIDLNQNDAETLYEELEEAFDSEWATFIVGYRQQEQHYSENDSSSNQDNNDSQKSENSQNTASNGKNQQSGGNSSASSDSKNQEEVEQQEHATGELDLSKPLNQKLDSILALIGSKIKIKYKNSEKSTVVAPLFSNDPDSMREYLTKLMDHATIGEGKSLTGRVNVNLAPAAVLACVPGVDADLAENIVGRRPADPMSIDTYQNHPTWLLIEGLVTLNKMKALLPYLTAGGSVYKVQTVGFFDKDSSTVRLEALIDASESPPRMLSLKNLTPLGPGFDPLELGAEE